MTLKTIIVYGSKTQLASIRILESVESKEYAIGLFEVDLRLDARFKGRNIITRTYESYMNEQGLEKIDELAALFAGNWYKVLGNDCTSMHGISHGAAQELNVFHEAVSVYKNLEAAYQLLSEFESGYVYIGEGVSLVRWAWHAVADSFGVKSEMLELDDHLYKRVPHPQENHVGLSRINLPKFNPIGSSIIHSFKFRQIFSASDSKQSSQSTDQEIRIAAQTGRSTCEPWFEELESSNKVKLVPLKNTKNFNLPGTKPITKIIFLIRWFFWKQKILGQSLFTYRNVDMRPYWEKKLSERFINVCTGSSLKARNDIRYLNFVLPKALLMTWHNTRPYHFELAKRLNIPLIVFQDSWLGESAPGGGNRRCVRCHHMFVWGDITKGWTRHIEPAKSHIVGNPRSTTLKMFNKRAVDHPSSVGTRLKVLFTHQCWGPWSAFHSPLDTNDMWDTIAQAAKELPDVYFVGKIHPMVDHPNHEWPGRSEEIREWVSGQRLDNFRTLPLNMTMEEALKDVDLVVTYYSLTAVEALTQGVPVVMLNVTSKRDLLPELEKYGNTPVARSTEEFVTLIGRISNNIDGFQANKSDVDLLLKKLFGVSVSIVNHIVSICQE